MNDFDKNVATIYRAINKINGKCYTGYDSNWPRRLKQHKEKYKNENRKFYDAIKKYGWNNFEWEIVYQSWDLDYCLKVMEPHFIKEFNSVDNGYNMTFGGEGTLGFEPWNKNKTNIYTQETLKKMQLAKKGLYEGKNNPNYGIKCNDEKKKKIAIARQNTKKVTCNYCNKVGDPGIMSRWHFNNCKLKV
jgi:group I intron endonuclease